MINVPEQWMGPIRGILKEHVPGYEIRVFGSRITDHVKKYSDLDLVVMTVDPLPVATLALLKLALEESNIPFKVDVLDWAATDTGFRAVIERDYEVLTEG